MSSGEGEMTADESQQKKKRVRSHGDGRTQYHVLPRSGKAGVLQALRMRSKKIVTGLPTALTVPHSEPGTIWGKAGRGRVNTNSRKRIRGINLRENDGYF